MVDVFGRGLKRGPIGPQGDEGPPGKKGDKGDPKGAAVRRSRK